MQSDRMNDPRYANWIKTALSLVYVKEGLVEFANTHVSLVHADILTKVKQKSVHAAKVHCQTCTNKSIKQLRNKQSSHSSWDIKCNSSVCNVWLGEILHFHAHQPLPKVPWVNTDPTKWPAVPWEAVKVFLPIGAQGFANANDCDCAALLTLMLDCKYFHKYLLSTQILRDIKDIRNKVMHSKDLLVDDAEYTDWTATMIALLEDPKHLQYQSHCQEAVTKIKELRDTSLDIALNRQLEIEALNQRLSSFDVEMQQLKQETASLQINIATLSFDNNEIRNSVLSCEICKDEITSVHLQLTQILKDISKFREFLTNVGDIDLKQKLEETRLRVTEIDKQNSADLQKINDLVSRFDCFERKIDSRLLNLESNVQTIDLQLHTLDSKYETKVQELQLNFAESSHSSEHRTALEYRLQREEKAQGRSSHSKTDPEVLRFQSELISFYYAYCKDVQLNPGNDDETGDIEEIYVFPLMKKINTSEDDARASTSIKSVQVGCYADILESTGNRRSYRNIYIAGEAGNGKTALCLQLVRLWCQAHMNVHDKDKDLELMKSFDLLFYIPLRSFTACSDIESMLARLFKQEACTMLERKRCLIILDGLDEWEPPLDYAPPAFHTKGLPHRMFNIQNTIITTTRPWKLEVLRLKPCDVDCHVELIGIGDEAIKMLVKSMLKLLTKTTDAKTEKQPQQFLDEIENNKLGSFLQTPVVLKQMLCLWFDEKQFGKFKSDIYAAMLDRALVLAEQDKTLPRLAEPDKHKKYSKPACFANCKGCLKYMSLIYSLAKLAFHTLFTSKKESSLVFEHSETKLHGLDQSDVEFCLKAGILTQHRVAGKSTKRLKSLTFIHKTNQEFLAVVYTLFEEVKVSKLLNKLDSIQELKGVLTFASEMNQRVFEDSLKHFTKLLNSDARVKSYRHSCEEQFADLISELQTVLFEIVQNSCCSILVPLEDIVVEDKCSVDIRRHLHFKTEQLKSLSIRIPTNKDVSKEEKINYNLLFGLACRSKSLKKLYLYDDQDVITAEHVMETLTSTKGSLYSLGLGFISFTHIGSIFKTTLNLLNIKSLGLWSIRLTHDQLEGLSHYLLQSLPLKELELCSLVCVTHRDTECEFRLDLSRMKQLSKLNLWGLTASSVVVHPQSLKSFKLSGLRSSHTSKTFLRSLQNAKQLQECVFHKCDDTDTLVEIVPVLKSVEMLKLTSMELNDHIILLHLMRNLQIVTLKRIGIEDKSLLSFLANLPEQQLEINISRVSIHGVNFKKSFSHKYITESPKFIVQKGSFSFDACWNMNINCIKVKTGHWHR